MLATCPPLPPSQPSKSYCQQARPAQESNSNPWLDDICHHEGLIKGPIFNGVSIKTIHNVGQIRIAKTHMTCTPFPSTCIHPLPAIAALLPTLLLHDIHWMQLWMRPNVFDCSIGFLPCCWNYLGRLGFAFVSDEQSLMIQFFSIKPSSNIIKRHCICRSSKFSCTGHIQWCWYLLWCIGWCQYLLQCIIPWCNSMCQLQFPLILGRQATFEITNPLVNCLMSAWCIGIYHCIRYGHIMDNALGHNEGRIICEVLLLLLLLLSLRYH